MSLDINAFLKACTDHYGSRMGKVDLDAMLRHLNTFRAYIGREVAPDESTVTVRATSPYPLHADITLPTAFVGTCTVTQEFVIDFTGAEPAIRDLRIGQTPT